MSQRTVRNLYKICILILLSTLLLSCAAEEEADPTVIETEISSSLQPEVTPPSKETIMPTDIPPPTVTEMPVPTTSSPTVELTAVPVVIERA